MDRASAKVPKSRGAVGIIHAYPSRYLIDSLVSAGWEPVLIGPSNDPFRRTLSEDSLIDVSLGDTDEIIAAVSTAHRRRPFAALLSVYEGASVLNARLSEVLELRGVPLAAALASRNKYLSNQIWRGAGVPAPRTIPLVDLENGYRAIEQVLGYPVVLKLADSMNSQGVVKVADRREYGEAIERLLSLLDRPRDFDPQVDRNRWVYGQSDIKIIAQEFCSGAEVGVDVLVNGRESIVLGMFEKASTAGPYFAESMSVWPTSLGEVLERQLGEIAARALRALAITSGVGHVEIRYSEDGPRVLEAGLRPGGAYTVRAVEQLTGVNTYQQLASLTADLTVKAPRHPRGAALYGGVVYPRTGTLRAVSGVDVFTDLPGLLDLQILNQPGDAVCALPESAQPHFCYYLLHGPSRDAVVDIHRRIQSCVHVDVA